jgi:RNA polymerase sigma-70 factor (ECF subfamily)
MQRELVERARTGDREAFSELARATLDRQYAVAYLILRDGDRAQDAVQEALVSAWRDMRSLRDPDAWDAWLHRLTVRCCYRLASKERRRSLQELSVESDHDGSGPTDLVSSLAERDRMERELIKLPIDQRAALVLRFYLDLPVATVATILDIPIGTAKSRLHYGIQALRSSMDDSATASMRGLEPSA